MKTCYFSALITVVSKTEHSTYNRIINVAQYRPIQLHICHLFLSLIMSSNDTGSVLQMLKTFQNIGMFKSISSDFKKMMLISIECQFYHIKL